MEILSYQPIAYTILDNLTHKDVDHYCWVMPWLRLHCQSPQYWQHRIDKEFNNASHSEDTRETYDWLINCLRGSNKELVLCLANPIDRHLDLLVNRVIDEAPLGLEIDAFLAAGRANRLDLIDRLVMKFGSVDIGHALMGAVKYDHLPLVVDLLDRYTIANLNTPLRTAAKLGYRDIVIELINRGASLEWALIHAAAGGHHALVYELLGRGATNINRALIAASNNEHGRLVIDLIRLMHNRGWSIAIQRERQLPNTIHLGHAIKSAISGGHRRLVNDLIRLAGSMRPVEPSGLTTADLDDFLAVAARDGHSDIVVDLINHGATDLNRALGRAAVGGRRNVIVELINHGAMDLENAARLADISGHHWLARVIGRL